MYLPDLSLPDMGRGSRYSGGVKMKVKKITISLTEDLYSRIRAYADEACSGNFSGAVQDLTWLALLMLKTKGVK